MVERITGIANINGEDVYFSGGEVLSKDKWYMIVHTSKGETIRSILPKIVDKLPHQSKYARELEQWFQSELENGNIEAETLFAKYHKGPWQRMIGPWYRPVVKELGDRLQASSD